MRVIYIIFLIMLLNAPVHGQMDSVQRALSLDDYLSLVVTNHPVVRQANLLEEMAQAQIRTARGSFDPVLSSEYRLKNFDQKEYYNLLNTTLKVPVWFPVDPKVSLDRNKGEFVSAESSIPESSDFLQVSAGLSLPLGKGLFIDERRAIVRQASLVADLNEAEKVSLINKTLLNAIKDYWSWYLAYRELRLLEQSRDIADELFDRIILDYGFGEAAVVDTIQAKIVYQSRMADYEKAKFEYISSGLDLSVNLWTEELIPLEILDNIIPDTSATFPQEVTDDIVADLILYAGTNHPDLIKVETKLEQLSIERQWNIESLKPTVNLSYDFINAPISPEGEITTPGVNDNYKFGLDFYFPLWLRKERGKLQKTNLKLLEGQFSRDQQRLAIRNRIISRYAELQMSETLTSQYLDMANNYNRLLQAEFLNLEVGESDLFKLNIQQDKYIESQMKYYQNLIKYEKNKAEILFDAGVPMLDLSQLNP